MNEILQKIERKFENATERDKLLMILSNYIDIGSSSGGAISVKQFDELADTLIQFKCKNIILEVKNILKEDNDDCL